MRKFRFQRILAITAASAVLLCQPGITGLAQEAQALTEAFTTEAETSSEVPTEPVTEAPAPAPTEAVTEAPQPVTEAPAPQPVTEAPAPEPTEAPAPPEEKEEEIVPEAEPEEPVREEPVPEPETAKETELFKIDDEEPVSSLSTSAGDLEVTLTLPGGRTVSADSELKVTALTVADGGAFNNALSLVREKTDRGHRSLSELALYRVEIENGGERMPLDGEAKLTFAWSSPVSLGLTPWMQGEAFVYRVGDAAEELCRIDLLADGEDNRSFTGFEISGRDLSLIGVAGVENKGPQSGRKTKKDLQKDLKDLSDYAAVANRLELEEGVFLDDLSMAGEIIDGSGLGDGTEKTAQAKKVEAVLEVAALAGLKIADSASSEEVSFVTVYADENGNIDEEPLGAWLKQTENGEEVLDVTDALLVINIAANDAQQDLELPEWDIYVHETEREEEDDDAASAIRKVKEDAGRVLYNLVAEDGNKLTKYEGELTVKENEKGTILAPQAKVILEKENIGAVYADQVTLKKEASLERAAFAEEEEEQEIPAPAQEAEPVSEETAEEVSEEPTEEVSEEPAGDAGEEQSEGKLNFSATLDAPRLAAEEQVVRITVNAYLGAEGDEPLPANLTFGVYDEEGLPIKDNAGNSFAVRTIQAGSKTLSFLIDSTYEDVFKGADVYVRPAGDLIGYRLLSSDPEDGLVKILEGGEGAEPDTVELRYEEAPENYFRLSVRAVKESNGKVFSRTAVYTIEDENGSKLENNKGEEVKIELPDSKNIAFTPNADNYPLFAGIEPGTNKTFYVVQESVTVPWTAKEERLKFVVFRDEKGNYSVAESEDEEEEARHSGKNDALPITFLYSKPKAAIALKIKAVQADTEKDMTPDQKLVYELQDPAGKKLLSVTLDKSNPRKITIDTAASSFFDDLTPGTVKEFALVRTDVPDGFKYLNTRFRLCASMDEKGVVSVYRKAEPDETHTGKDDPLELTFRYEKIPALTSDSIKVTKSVYLGEDTGIYHTGDYKYYVALFKDKNLTKRVKDAGVRTISFTGSGLTASTTFSNLTPGTYYVGETDAKGNPVGREKDKKKAADPFYVDYSGQKVKVSGISTKTIPVEMKNHYFEMPADCAYYGRIKITKRVTDENGNPQNSGGTFFFMVNNDTKNIKRISMEGTSSAWTYVYLKASEESKQYTITEVRPRIENGSYAKDGDGKYIFDEMTNSSGSVWNVYYQNQTVTVTKGQKEVPEVIVTNRAINRGQPESGTGPEAGTETGTSTGKPSDTATITMVKKATYKGNPIRLNSTFYFGIFEDAALTKLRSAPVKMTLSNASEKQRTMTVNLYMLEKDKRTVTLYFAETDKNGKVLTSANSAYEVSPQGAIKVTVDPQNPEATVTFTNNITVGSSMENRLLDPESGLAGDASAVDDSYRGIGGTAEEGTSGSGTSAKTGDDTPLALWMTTLLCACVVAWLMLGQKSGRRRKEGR